MALGRVRFLWTVSSGQWLWCGVWVGVVYLVLSMVTLDQLSSEEWLVDLEYWGGGGGMFVVVMHWSQSSSVDRYSKK